MGTGSFPGVKRPGRGVDHPPPSSAEVEGVELYLCSPSEPSWPVLGRSLPLPYTVDTDTLVLGESQGLGQTYWVVTLSLYIRISTCSGMLLRHVDF